MASRSPRSPSRRSGIISPPRPSSSPPPMPISMPIQMSTPSSSGSRRLKVSAPMPLPLPVTPASMPEPTWTWMSPSPSPLAGPSRMGREQGVAVEEDDQRERRRERRKSKRREEMPAFAVEEAGQAMGGVDFSAVGKGCRSYSSEWLQSDRKQVSEGKDDQECFDYGRLAGEHQLLYTPRATALSTTAFPTPIKDGRSKSQDMNRRDRDCLEVPLDTSVHETSSAVAWSTFQTPTPIVTIQPSPSSPRISAMASSPPSLPDPLATPLSYRAKRASGIGSGIRSSIPPPVGADSSSLPLGLSPSTLPPLPLTPSGYPSPGQPGSVGRQQRAAAGYGVTSPRPTRSTYDVTSPRPVRASRADKDTSILHSGPVGDGLSPYVDFSGGGRPSRSRDGHQGYGRTTELVAPLEYASCTAAPVDFASPADTADPDPFARILPHETNVISQRRSTDSRLLPAMRISPVHIASTSIALHRKQLSTHSVDNASSNLQPRPVEPLDATPIFAHHTPLKSPGARPTPTPTPPRPARRRYDTRSPSITPGQAMPVPQAQRPTMQPSPLVLPSPAVRTQPSGAGSGSKRDSTQRRLDALKGLVGNIDFGQPWSMPSSRTSAAAAERPDEQQGLMEHGRAQENCPDSEDAFTTPLPGAPEHGGSVQRRSQAHHAAGTDQARYALADQSVQKEWSKRERPKIGSQVKLRAASPGRPLGAVSQDHGWPSPSTTPVRAVRDTPPRPRQRSEVFDVASAGYNSSAPVTPAVRHPEITTTGRASQGHLNTHESMQTPQAPSTWRATLSSDTVYTRLYALDPDRVTRQEIMWEMCETEQVFLRSIRTVLRLFATPVKTPQGKWIDGIPAAISELFDNLESIAHVHGILCASQRDMQRRAEVLDLDAFIAVLKNWTPRLGAAYEWYLCKFEAVVAMVEDHVRDSESVFGEFVRMQLQDDALGSMSLGSMLLKPVQRLMKYPLFLKRLADVTPRHPELMSLIGTTESIIHSLQATKAKEDEYRQLKLLESRLSFPPDVRSLYGVEYSGTDPFKLATRGRKLLGMSTVHRLQPSAMSMPVRSSIASSTSSAGTSSCYFSQTPSRQSSFSVSSVSSGPSRNGSLRTSMSMSMSMSLPMSPGGLGGDRLRRTPSSASIGHSASGDHSPRASRTRRSKDELTLFVLDDLVILAQAHEKGGLFTSKTKKERGWRVLPENEGGLGRVVGVREWEGPVPCFLLTILPLSPDLPSVSLCLAMPVPREPASPSPSPSQPTTKRGAAALLPGVTSFTTMARLMQTLQETQTVSDQMEMVGDKRELDLDVGMDMLEIGRIESGAVRNEGMDMVYPQYYSPGGLEEHPLFSLKAMGY